MFREVTTAGWLRSGFGPFRRYHFSYGKIHRRIGLTQDEHDETLRDSMETPQMTMSHEGRQFWLYCNRTYWDDEDLKPEDVVALVAVKEKRQERRLQRAHETTALEKDAPYRRTGIPLELRKIVWERDGGKCVKCGAEFELQFDHVIPVTMGGATTERNLELLCGSCNREKGASLG